MSDHVPADLRRRVRAQFSDCCAYCRTAESLTVAIFEVEHIVPRSVGGKSVLKNLCLACPSCNRFKSNRSVAVDPESEQEVPLFHPQRERWADHFAWAENSTVIKGLTAIGRATVVALRMNREQITRVRRMWVTMHEHPPQID